MKKRLLLFVPLWVALGVSTAALADDKPKTEEKPKAVKKAKVDKKLAAVEKELSKVWVKLKSMTADMELNVVKAGTSTKSRFRTDRCTACESCEFMSTALAIALENAILYQKSAELTVTDDLTKLFNSRYLNVHLRREIKRSRRYGVQVSLVLHREYGSVL